MNSLKNRVVNLLRSVTNLDNSLVDYSDNPQFGDLSSNVAMVIAKERGKKPKEVAEEIISKIDKEYFAKIEMAGPGFVNLWLKNDILLDNLLSIVREKEKYGSSNFGNGKTVIVDYSSPNIAKPFGIGHLRSTVIGQALYNLYKSLGYKVIGDNHLGDWGTQFGKLLYMINEVDSSDYSIENLEKLYVEFHKRAENDPMLEEKAREWFKKLEDGDEKARTIWKQCINTSLNEFERIYKLLGVKIDNAYGESFYEEEMKKLIADKNVQDQLQDGEDGKSKVVNLEEFGIKTPLMFLKSDGATTYATRDLATIKFRTDKWNPDIIIYEVGAEQSLHFNQVFAAAKKLGLLKENVILHHTKHGLYLAPDGKKFSTRKGKTVKLEEILNEAIDRARKLGNEEDKTSEVVGIGAIKYFDLMHSVQSDVVFDWEKILNLEGNSGPYLQYTYARTQSVLEKSGKEDLKLEDATKLEVKNINNEERLILSKLSQFEDIITDAAKSYSPNLICNYLFDLSSKFNTFYNMHKIIGGDNEEFRLVLTRGVGQVVKNGLNLLGIESPKRM